MTNCVPAAVLFLMLVAVEGHAQGDGPPDSISPTTEDRAEDSFQWKPALLQSMLFLGIEHSFRLTQAETRAELKGPFFPDYFRSVRGYTKGWSDGDSTFKNYAAHPSQGAVAGFIQIHNDPSGKYLQFGNTAPYWKSRLKATAWAAAYSTQFEIGPVSESTIGNFGKKDGTGGIVDLITTPIGGFGWILAEDALDRHVVRKKELGTSSLNRRRLYRIVLNPTRTFANLLRMKKPWHRDDRPISD